MRYIVSCNLTFLNVIHTPMTNHTDKTNKCQLRGPRASQVGVVRDGVGVAVARSPHVEWAYIPTIDWFQATGSYPDVHSIPQIYPRPGGRQTLSLRGRHCQCSPGPPAPSLGLGFGAANLRNSITPIFYNSHRGALESTERVTDFCRLRAPSRNQNKPSIVDIWSTLLYSGIVQFVQPAHGFNDFLRPVHSEVSFVLPFVNGVAVVWQSEQILELDR